MAEVATEDGTQQNSEFDWVPLTENFSSEFSDVQAHFEMPRELVAIRRNLYPGKDTEEEIRSSFKDIGHAHKKCGEEKSQNALERVFEWARRESDAQHGLCQKYNLGFEDLVHLRAYTLDVPPYFRELNPILYKLDHSGRSCPELLPWTSFLNHVDKALHKLQQQQQQQHKEALAKGMVDPQRTLKRAAWVPSDKLEGPDFEVRKTITFNATMSSTTEDETIETFYNDSMTKNLAEGKQFVVFVFDEDLRAEAPRISEFSEFPREKECLFRVWTSAEIVSRERTFIGQREQCLIHLRGRCAMPSISGVLDWEPERGAGIAAVLKFAVMIGAHMDRDSAFSKYLRQIFQVVEHNIAMAVELTAARLGPHRLEHNISTVGCCNIVGMGLARWHIPERTKRSRKMTDGEKQKLQQQFIKEQGDKLVEKLDAMKANNLSEMTLREILGYISTHWLEYNEAQQGSRQLDQELEDQEKEQNEQEEHETKVLLYWLKMNLAAEMIADIIAGTVDVGIAESPFPVLERDVFSSDSDNCVNPAWVALVVGRAVLEPAESKAEASCRCLAALDLLRVITSRIRLMVVLGLPDSGKTSLLNEVFGLRLDAGQGQAGATKFLTISEGPDFDKDKWPMLLVDIPGVKDVIETRDDVIQMTMSMLEHDHIKDALMIVVVYASGERDKDFKKLVQAYHDKCPKMAFICTMCDKIYMDRAQLENLMDDSPRRKSLADEMKKKNREYVKDFMSEDEDVM